MDDWTWRDDGELGVWWWEDGGGRMVVGCVVLVGGGGEGRRRWMDARRWEVGGGSTMGNWVCGWWEDGGGRTVVGQEASEGVVGCVGGGEWRERRWMAARRVCDVRGGGRRRRLRCVGPLSLGRRWKLTGHVA